MNKFKKLFSGLQTQITAIFIVAMFIIAFISTSIIYTYTLHSSLKQLKEKLLVLTQTSALMIDGDLLRQVPLNHEGTKSAAFLQIMGQLNAIKQANPEIKYIYTMAKTSQKGTLQFVVDPDVFNPQSMEAATSYPGDRYDASRFPEMLKSFYYPTTDEALGKDEWGVFISGYAPVKDKDGRTAGIVGIDLAAEHVYNLEREIYIRGGIVLILVLIFALISGPIFSRKIIRPLHTLLEGTRKIAKGDLQYKVEVKGSAELKELADAFNSMSLSLQDSQKLMHDYFYSLMESMVRILEDRDSYTRGHSDRVALYAEKIAMEMEYSPAEVALVRKAALLHDIGKLGVDKGILDKSTPLTPEEIKIIQEHPVVGENILKPIVFDREILPIVRSHHERFDGKGYPDKLKSKDINIFAQIISVADAYDAMISPRSYRPTLTREQAILELKKGSGSQFNPWIVRNMLKILYSEQY